MKKNLTIICLSLIFSLVGKAQVGINTVEPNATLDIQASATDATTAEGLIAPKLTLSQLMLKDSKYLEEQKGALVYVTDVTGTPSGKSINVTSIGYYYFDGFIWQSIGVPTEPWLVQNSVLEATSNTQNIYQKGKVSIGIDTSEDQQLYVEGDTKITGKTVLGATSADNTEVNGALTLKNIQGQSNSLSLVADINTGIVGLSVTQPAKVFFAQKRQNQAFMGSQLTSFRAGSSIVVTWNTQPVSVDGALSFVGEDSDIVTNNTSIIFDEDTNEFVFNDDIQQMYEINGYVNYIARAQNSASANVNIIVEIKRNGETTWSPFTGSRSTFVNSSYASTCTISSATAYFRKGDRIRLVLTQSVGNNHGPDNYLQITDITKLPGILRPSGLRYVAGLKISAL